MDRAYLKSKSKEQLRGRWPLAIITVIVSNFFINTASLSQGLNLIIDVSDKITSTFNIISLIFGGVISVGLSKFLLNFTSYREEPSFKDIFSYFNIFFKSFGLQLLMTVIILFGCILFIVPGIILSLMYSQAYYILAEDPTKGIFECLEESSKLMYGYKWEFFLLGLSFIGWWLLSALTFGIGSLWVQPYQEVTSANFYLKLKYNI
ncbi:MAG: DUF975 family protein [Clostridium sartagoforme]|nr:DUF975 family protein [Clostridium sartagoforme]